MIACTLTGTAGYLALTSDAGAQVSAAQAQEARLADLAARTGTIHATATAVATDRARASATDSALDAALHTAARDLAAAAAAEPGDGDELAAVNASLVRYATTVERARMATAAGRSPAALLDSARTTLDAGVSAPLGRLAATNRARAASAEAVLGGSQVFLGLATFASLSTLIAGSWWLARKTHRVINPGLLGSAVLTTGVAAVAASALSASGGGVPAALAATPGAGSLLLLGGLGAGALAVAGVGRRMREYR